MTGAKFNDVIASFENKKGNIYSFPQGVFIATIDTSTKTEI